MQAPTRPLASPTAPFDSAPADTLAAQRRGMIDSQLRTSDVTDPAILAAVSAVAREAFVPVERQAQSYADRAIMLGWGRSLNPTLTTARLILDADIGRGDKVLLIGGATGYAAALLAELGAEVTMVEEAPALAAHARTALAGYGAVRIVEAALAGGAPDGAPYDRLVIDGAIEHIPSALLGQLTDGARIATGVVDRGVTRLARAVYIDGASAVHPLAYADLECVALPGFAPPPRFVF